MFTRASLHVIADRHVRSPSVRSAPIIQDNPMSLRITADPNFPFNGCSESWWIAMGFFSSLTAAWKCGVYYDDGFIIDDYIDEVDRLGPDSWWWCCCFMCYFIVNKYIQVLWIIVCVDLEKVWFCTSNNP